MTFLIWEQEVSQCVLFNKYLALEKIRTDLSTYIIRKINMLYFVNFASFKIVLIAVRFKKALTIYVKSDQNGIMRGKQGSQCQQCWLFKTLLRCSVRVRLPFSSCQEVIPLTRLGQWFRVKFILDKLIFHYISSKWNSSYK